jgi:hypothetical protein
LASVFCGRQARKRVTSGSAPNDANTLGVAFTRTTQEDAFRSELHVLVLHCVACCYWGRSIERIGLLAGSSGLDMWKASHRPAFFKRFGFSVPEVAIPQTLMCSRSGPAKPVFEACVP